MKLKNPKEKTKKFNNRKVLKILDLTCDLLIDYGGFYPVLIIGFYEREKKTISNQLVFKNYIPEGFDVAFKKGTLKRKKKILSQLRLQIEIAIHDLLRNNKNYEIQKSK